MNATATLSSKFQISLPKTIRDQQHWHAGQKVVFIPKGNGVLMMPVPSLAELKGLLPDANDRDYRDREDAS